jgi:hypothetical protein
MSKSSHRLELGQNLLALLLYKCACGVAVVVVVVVSYRVILRRFPRVEVLVAVAQETVKFLLPLV